jgi:hypothetical protein
MSVQQETPELAEQFVQLAESGNQQRIQLRDGQILQGWIMEISETALQISTGFAEKSGQDRWIEFNEVDLDQLFYWDIQQSVWQPFMIKPSHKSSH